MADSKKDDVTQANQRISRPEDERGREGRDGKVFAGQRHEFAANPVGDEGVRKSETETIAERAGGKANAAGGRKP